MTKSVQRGRKATKKTTGARKAATARKESTTTLSREKQTSLYDKAMKHMSAGEFAKAAQLFDRVVEGPGADVAHAARMHRSNCQRRLKEPVIRLESAEDHYNYAITLLNQREPDRAREHLEEALAGNPRADHVYYALCLSFGMEGNIDAAAENLERAVEINPRNRLAARNDPDFEPLLGEPQIRALLQIERTESE
jgi:tetratricopeptide (TPR) repeat protein